MKRGILLFLLFFLCMSGSVHASTLSSDENSTSGGSTTVTARIEMPADETSDETDEIDGKDTTVHDTGIRKIIFIMGIGGMMIAVIWKTRSRINKTEV